MRNQGFSLLASLVLLESLVVASDLSSLHIGGGGFLGSGYSAIDLLLLFAFVLIILAAASGLFWRKIKQVTILFIEGLLSKPGWLIGTLAILCLIIYEAFQDILFIEAEMPLVHYLNYRQFLAEHYSVLLFLLLGGLQIFVFVVSIFSQRIREFVQQRLNNRLYGVFGILLLIIFLIQISGYGMDSNPDQGGRYNTLNAPLPGIQVILILLLMLFVAWIVANLSNRYPIIQKLFRIEAVVVLFIWVITFISWTQTPLGPHYYVDGPRPPNQELYPSSDPIYFDTQAHRVFIGEGFEKEEFSKHPMYSLMLSIFHRIAGDGYLDIIPLQLALLSFTPVLLFKLATLIHNRLSGFIVSILFIIRERNALLLGEHITVSNAKVLMTEPLFLLCILLFVYLLLLWVKDSGKNSLLVILLGGAIGFAMLIRIEVQLFLPGIIIGTMIYFRNDLITWLKGMTLMIAAIAVIIVPWMARNQQVLGSFTIDKPRIYQKTLTEFLESFAPSTLDSDPSGSNILPHAIRGDQGSEFGLTKIASIRSQLLDYTDQAIEEEYNYEKYVNHFFNNLVQTVYFLPSNHQPLLTIGSLPKLFSIELYENDLEGDRFGEKYLERYVKSLPYWSYSWDGKLVPRSFIPVMITLIVLSIGITRMKGLSAWTTRVLFFTLLLYCLAYGFLRYSGGRYISAVEWIFLMYYGIGLSSLISGQFQKIIPHLSDQTGLMAQQHLSDRAAKEYAASRWMVYPAWILIILVGFSLYGADLWMTPQYSQYEIKNIMSSKEFSASNSSKLIRELESRDLQPEIVLGKALYPKFYEAGESMEDDRKGTIPDSSIQRLEFYMVGVKNGWIILPGLGGKEYFPHASNVLIIGTKVPGNIDPVQGPISGDYILAEQILIFSDEVDSGKWFVLNCTGQDCILDLDIFP